MRRFVLAGAATLSLFGASAAACTGATQVDEIYPSGDAVPENLLRMYLYFTAPMGDGDIVPLITLRNADGSLVEDAFLSNRFDLWSPDRTRLTLLFDPGRVKTGLEAHDRLGRALVAGESYVLTVGDAAIDAEGCSLAATFSHSFVAGPSDVEVPDPYDWNLNQPMAGTTEPLRVSLGSPHDHLSMAFRIQVRHGGKILPGGVSLEGDESVWVFTPRDPWSAARYELSVKKELEDLAGNRPGELFDQPIGMEIGEPELSLWFRPGGT